MAPTRLKPRSLKTSGSATLPCHIAIVMDGNGRWAQQRNLPRVAGHRAGVEAVRRTIRSCGEQKIEVLTLFAFSSENWRRPQVEVGFLMDLFLTALQIELDDLHRHQVRLRVIGTRDAFTPKLQAQIAEAERITANNTGLQLVIAANYGGRWDILEAARRLAVQVEQGKLTSSRISIEMLEADLCLHDLPEPDLFIRTGGEQRISNFLLWQMAYTELYFTDVLWPDFEVHNLAAALEWFATRERRFGHTGDQIADFAEQAKGA